MNKANKNTSENTGILNRNQSRFFILSIMMTTFFTLPLFSQKELSWQFYQADQPETIYQMGSKGCVQKTFRDNGILPDPFVGLNEEKYGWIENKDWIFESKFTLTKEDFQKQFIDLYFKNIDVYATIYVNDIEIGKSESTFIPYRFEVKKHLKIGENTVRLHFVSPINYHKEEYKSLKVKYPTPNDANDSIQVVSMTRKPQYQFGWDWALRMNTIGLNEPAFVEMYDENKVLQTSVQTLGLSEEEAKMSLNIIFRNKVKSDDVNIESELIKKSHILSVKNLDENTVQMVFTVKNPQLYWPIGYGKQHLYHAPLKVLLNRHQLYESDNFYFGISQKSLIQKEDEWGTSFEIHWNDSLIFCKGGDYIPQDVFLSDITEKQMKDLIDQCVTANFNMIRIWGGGYYLPDFFYRYCAEKGIMIWQDFMFACSLYPGDDHFLSLVKSEAEFQIPRIATHPNIAYFNGNNEVMVASKYWGFKLKYHYGDKTEKQFEDNYNRLFKQLLPNEVKKWTTIPYEHTSPLSHWGKDEWYRNGTQHYWGVWHGSDPLEDMARKSGRFNAEYGFQSFPEYSTWLKISKREDWNLDSDVIKQHQKSYVGNGMILKQATKLFGKPINFEDFIYLSQLTQAEAVSLAISSQRLQFPRVTGTLYWQINDCWPVSSWSSIDYYGNWKALHYRVKEDFEPIAVLRNWEDKSFKYYIFSDLQKAEKIKLYTTIYSFGGKRQYEDVRQIEIHPFEKIAIDEFLQETNNTKNYTGIINYEWEYKNQKHSRTFILNERNYKRFDNPEITISKIEKVENHRAILHFENKGFAAYTWFTSEKSNLHFFNNFQHYLPGKHAMEFEFEDTVPKIDEIIIKTL